MSSIEQILLILQEINRERELEKRETFFSLKLTPRKGGVYHTLGTELNPGVCRSTSARTMLTYVEEHKDELINE